MERAEVSYSSANAKAIALLLCDIFFSFDQAVEALPRGSAITAASFMPSLESLGASFSAATLPVGGFGPGRRYPVVAGYPYAFDAACQCMAYTGARFTLR